MIALLAPGQGAQAAGMLTPWLALGGARSLVAQVTSPVRWDSCMATLRSLGVTATIELPPAGTAYSGAYA